MGPPGGEEKRGVKIIKAETEKGGWRGQIRKGLPKGEGGPCAIEKKGEKNTPGAKFVVPRGGKISRRERVVQCWIPDSGWNRSSTQPQDRSRLQPRTRRELANARATESADGWIGVTITAYREPNPATTRELAGRPLQPCKQHPSLRTS